MLREYQMNRIENTNERTATAMSRTKRPAILWRSARHHLSCASAEKPYGMAAVIPDMSTSVVKASAPPAPR